MSAAKPLLPLYAFRSGKKQLHLSYIPVIHCKTMLIKIQPDARVCRYLFTVKSLYMVGFLLTMNYDAWNHEFKIHCKTSL